MAQKSGNREVIEFVPSIEKKDPKPFTVYFKPLSKGEYDKHISTLGEFKRNKFISHVENSFENLCLATLTAGRDGSFLKNVYWTPKGGSEKLYESVADRDLAIEMLCGLTNLEMAGEIELAMKSQSTLDEDEVKN